TFAGSTITIGVLAAANQIIASLTSSAAFALVGGPLTINGSATFANTLSQNANLTLNGTSTMQAAYNLTGGSLSGSGALTIGGLSTWAGGAISGTGAISANGGLTIPAGQVILDTRTLNVTGTTTQAGTTGANLLLQNNAVINNSAGSTWTIANGTNNGILANGGTANTFNNAGTFQMTGGTANNVSVIFNNTGTVNANV